MLLSLCNVNYNIERRHILTDINLTVDHGDFVAVSGPNGGGKTSMLRIILGLLKPSSGSVEFPCGKPTVGYLPQKNSVDAHFPISVKEVVASGLLNSHWTREEKAVRVAEVLHMIEMEQLQDRAIGRLSGGQMQRALFGRAIACRPSFLVLDEPLSYLDKHFENRLYEILATMGKDTTILLVSHEMTAIAAMANRHIMVDNTLRECTAQHHYVKHDCI